MSASGQQRDYEAEFEQLTEKQQAIITAHAEMPNAQNREKCERAAEILGEEVNTSYTSHVINRDYPEIARYYAFIRNEGKFLEEDTELEPPEDAIQVETTDSGIVFRLDRLYLEELIESGDLPDPLHERAVEAVMSRAFDSED